MIVLDASAWLDVLVGQAALPLEDPRFVVPPHFDAEVVGSLRALTRRDVLDREPAQLALDRHLRAPFRRDFSTDDVRTAWQWRESMSITDGWYAALAMRLRATWVTSDAKAARAAAERGVLTHVLSTD